MRQRMLEDMPLVPLAVAAVVGAGLDRWGLVGLDQVCVMGFMVAAAWLWARWRDQGVLALGLLWLGTGLWAAAWHHVHQEPLGDDVAHLATADGQLVRLRGGLASLPVTTTPPDAALRSLPEPARTTFQFRVEAIEHGSEWKPVRGTCKVLLHGVGPRASMSDEVEILGQLRALGPALNPGEVDPRQTGRDQGYHTLLTVKSVDAVAVVGRRDTVSVASALDKVRAAGRTVLESALPIRTATTARALLLGEASALDPDERSAYVRTGVIHVFAISGQHLVIVCGAVAVMLRLCGLPRRVIALHLAGFVMFYALLTGARPPVVRAAVVVVAACGAVLLRRTSTPMNTLALAWLVVFAINPADVFQTGCQLSFLAVLVLQEVARPWQEWFRREPDDPLDRLEAHFRPWWRTLARTLTGRVAELYLAGLVIWLAITPLTAASFHLVSPVAVLLGPPIVVLTGLALIAGMALLVVSTLGREWAGVPAWVADTSLSASSQLVHWADQLPGAYFHCPDVPVAWRAAVVFLALVLILRWWAAGRRPVILVAIALFLAGLAESVPLPRGDVTTVTVLAVGHGSCAVAELPDGRTLLFDAGALAGPEAAAWHIAPFLWRRGVARLDEVFLSHADLDHFNSLPGLLDRFDVKNVSFTPTFADKPTAGVRLILQRLAERGVVVRTLSRGQRLRAGPVWLDILHPPAAMRVGTENARSLVIRLTIHDRSLLLTGDLEEPGLSMVISDVSQPVDVLIAPHHGSPSSNTAAFAQWCRPGLVISSEGMPRRHRPDPYSALGSTVWRTFAVGAVTITVSPSGLRAVSHLDGHAWQPPGAAAPIGPPR